MIDLLESRIYLFSARSLTKGRLDLVEDDEGATDLPFSALDLFVIMKFW